MFSIDQASKQISLKILNVESSKLPVTHTEIIFLFATNSRTTVVTFLVKFRYFSLVQFFF